MKLIALSMICILLSVLGGPRVSASGPNLLGVEPSPAPGASAPAAPAQGPTWSLVASMSTPRAFKPAVLLANGNVLVAGGRGNPGHTDTAEIYNPILNEWRTVASMHDARALGMPIRMPNGRVLEIGGWNGSRALNTAEAYDPALDTWISTGTMTSARVYHTATLLPNGNVLASGGYNGTALLSSAEIYNFATNTWSAVNSMSSIRADADAIYLTSGPNSGKVLVIGGWNGTTDLNTTEFFNPANNTWSAGPNLVAVREGFEVQQLTSGPNSGKYLIFGGLSSNNATNTAEFYDPATNSFSAAPNMGAARDLFMSTRLLTGDIMAIGGLTGPVANMTVLGTTEIYSAANNTWTPAPSLAIPRYGHTETAVLLPMGVVMVAGGGTTGSDQTTNQPTVELYGAVWGAYMPLMYRR
jgi:WD40 repeat protein